ncbi:MAG: BMC domain-containing protein [Calditrichaeota bacterium]|nr:MAG: BMC domain-containing protein [Calditrichota bacterium]
MSDKALGLIETKGMIGAIEATDAAAKAAAVVVSSVELTEAAFMTVKIEGDLGAVQAAVEAGANAAQKVGELVSVHVIPNPSDELGAILPQFRYVTKYHPEDKRPALHDDVKPAKPKPVHKDSVTKKQTPRKQKKLESMTVSELRQIARKIDNFPLKGREISMANKKKLIDTLRSIKYEE